MHPQNETCKSLRVMRVNQVLSNLACVVAWGLLIASASAVELIPVVDYRDTFTVGGYRPANYYYGGSLFQVPYNMKYNVEYANPALPSEDFWKLPTTISFQSPSTAAYAGYPAFPSNTGNTGAASGMAQADAGGVVSIAYGKRNDYVVQADFDWNSSSGAYISSMAAPGSAPSATGGLSVYFTKGSQISLYNGVTQTATGIDTGILPTDTSWHNFAVGFNKTAGSLSVYVDQSLKGTLDLNTFAGGAYASYSNAAVGVGSSAGTRIWLDNFQVGGTTAWPDPPPVGAGINGLSRGHNILIQKGLQIQTFSNNPLSNDPATSQFDTTRWAESNFTTYHYGPGIYPASLMPAPPGIPYGVTNYQVPDGNINSSEIPYASQLVSYQIYDEMDVTKPDNLMYLKTVMQSLHVNQPNVLTYASQSQLQNTAAEVQAYMSYVKPDMLCIGSYPFQGTPSIVVGGSPTELYVAIEKYRKLGLAGNDGTGTQPIPTGLYTQSFKWGEGGHVVTESEIRLNQFAAWAFGYKFVDSFFYVNSEVETSPILPVMFTGNGSANPTPTFYQFAETNRQSRNLGPALVRLVSTGVSMKMGQHGSGSTNTLPEGVSSWSSGDVPYITSVTATNPGLRNNRLPGDVIVGAFKPLDASFTNPGHEDDVYFMIVNGLSDGYPGTAANCMQNILITFDFGTSGITDLLRLSRETGLVEEVPLTYLSGSNYSLSLSLDGGTGDLFKFNNGGTFVLPQPTAVIWTGGASTTWSTASGSGNWQATSGGGSAEYADGTDVTFGDVPTRTTADISVADVSPTTVLFNNDITNLTITGTKGIAGSATVTKQGAAKVTMTSVNTYTGATTVKAGTLEVGASAQAPVMTGTGGADIQGGKLVLDYTTAPDVKTALTASYAAGWATGQIRNTTAGTTGLVLGWKDDTGVKQVTVMATLTGDTDLSGSVTGSDLSTLLAKYNQAGTWVWSQGDFNYDTSVTGADLSLLLSKYNQSIPAGEVLGGSMAAPEPSSLVLLAISALLALGVAGRCRVGVFRSQRS